jgi:hypothetical protein
MTAKHGVLFRMASPYPLRNARQRMLLDYAGTCPGLCGRRLEVESSDVSSCEPCWRGGAYTCVEQRMAMQGGADGGSRASRWPDTVQNWALTHRLHPLI